MPRWWVWTFYATIVWALGYMIAYPGLAADLARRRRACSAIRAAPTSPRSWPPRRRPRPIISRDRLQVGHEILADEKLRTFATAAGAAAFKVNCVQCHGSGAQGGPVIRTSTTTNGCGAASRSDI
jgi:cytochrome c oxidase cbb3-type subunit 3